MLDISQYFTLEAIIRYLTQLPVLKTPVMDTIFLNRPQESLPMIGADLITPVVNEMPLAKRGGKSIPVLKESGSIAFFEPFPLRPDTFVKASDLNNLKLLGQSSIENWAMNKTDMLRRVVRKTTEAMAAISLSGTIAWPIKLEGGGWETYSVEFGSVLEVTPDVLWSAAEAKLKDVFVLLTDMQEKLQEKGYGGEIEIWAGKAAYNALFVIAENSKTTAKIRVEITEQGINIGGFLIKRRAETYRNPESGTVTQIIGNNVVKMIALDAGHLLPYCAVDDLDANLQPMPFFSKPIKSDNPSGYQIVGESKPFPIPNVQGICDATVISG